MNRFSQSLQEQQKIVTMATDYGGIDELLGLSTPRGGEHGNNNGVPSGPAVAVNNDHGDTAMGGTLQNREMEVPRWLSTTDVTGEFTINCNQLHCCVEK